MTTLEFCKSHLRLDHSMFDNHIEQLIKSAQAHLKIAGVTVKEDSEIQKLAILHFVNANFKNGQMTEQSEYVYPSVFHSAVEQARYE